MLGFRVVVTGAGETREFLASLSRDIKLFNRQRMREAVNSLAREVRANMRGLWEQRTGNLRRSHTRVYTERGLYTAVGLVLARPQAFYWRFLEDGTKKLQGRHGVALALDAKRGEIVRTLGRPLREIHRIGRRGR